MIAGVSRNICWWRSLWTGIFAKPARLFHLELCQWSGRIWVIPSRLYEQGDGPCHQRGQILLHLCHQFLLSISYICSKDMVWVNVCVYYIIQIWYAKLVEGVHLYSKEVLLEFRPCAFAMWTFVSTSVGERSFAAPIAWWKKPGYRWIDPGDSNGAPEALRLQ